VQRNNCACQRRAPAVPALQGGVVRRRPHELVMLGLSRLVPGLHVFASGRPEHMAGRTSHAPSPAKDDGEIARLFRVRNMCRSRHSQP
jgi:hypothetical protein